MNNAVYPDHYVLGGSNVGSITPVPQEVYDQEDNNTKTIIHTKEESIISQSLVQGPPTFSLNDARRNKTNALSLLQTSHTVGSFSNPETINTPQQTHFGGKFDSFKHRSYKINDEDQSSTKSFKQNSFKSSKEGGSRSIKSSSLPPPTLIEDLTAALHSSTVRTSSWKSSKVVSENNIVQISPDLPASLPSPLRLLGPLQSLAAAVSKPEDDIFDVKLTSIKLSKKIVSEKTDHSIPEFNNRHSSFKRFPNLRRLFSCTLSTKATRSSPEAMLALAETCDVVLLRRTKVVDGLSSQQIHNDIYLGLESTLNGKYAPKRVNMFYYNTVGVVVALQDRAGSRVKHVLLTTPGGLQIIKLAEVLSPTASSAYDTIAIRRVTCMEAGTHRHTDTDADIPQSRFAAMQDTLEHLAVLCGGEGLSWRTVRRMARASDDDVAGSESNGGSNSTSAQEVSSNPRFKEFGEIFVNKKFNLFAVSRNLVFRLNKIAFQQNAASVSEAVRLFRICLSEAGGTLTGDRVSIESLVPIFVEGSDTTVKEEGGGAGEGCLSPEQEEAAVLKLLAAAVPPGSVSQGLTLVTPLIDVTELVQSPLDCWQCVRAAVLQ